MNFRAYLRRNGEVFRRWRNEARIGGKISGVYFMWDGQNYVSDDPMHPNDVMAVQNNRMVQLELSAAPTGHVTIVEQVEPQKPVEQPEPPKSKVTLTLPQRPTVKIR